MECDEGKRCKMTVGDIMEEGSIEREEQMTRIDESNMENRLVSRGVLHISRVQ
jgi:hypothetical protein